MTEPISARLVRPPVQARLVRPPRRRGSASYLGPGLAAALHLPVPWVVLAAARLLRAAATAAPTVVAIGLFRASLARTGDPFAAIAGILARPALLLPGVGLAAALTACAALVEMIGWSLALPPLARSPEPAPFTQRFAALAQTAAALVVVAAVGALVLAPLVTIAARTWLDAHAAGGAGGLLASAALAIVLTIGIAASLLFRLVAEAAVVRVGGFGDRPLAGIYEGAALVLRKPLVFLAAFYLLFLATALAGAAFGIPAALAPPGAAGFGVRIGAEVATAAAAALLALARLAVFAFAARGRD